MSLLKPNAYDRERINCVCLILLLILGIFLLIPQIDNLRNTKPERNTEMRKREVIEYEESDYESFNKSVIEMSNQELSEIASRVIDGYFVPNYEYGSPNEDDFEDYKRDRILTEALNRLKRMR